MKIAVITPKFKKDYLTETILDGLSELGLEYLASNNTDQKKFLDFAEKSDMVIFCWGKNNTDYELAEEINQFQKTIFVDGSEVGRNLRYEKLGEINEEMLQKCKLYFRREKPYIEGVLPLPFGIESKYTKYYSENTKKDIDFFCIFGQDEYPILRKLVREELIRFCHENGFSCTTEKTDEDNFYRQLARSKVGISVGGGGFDTARFWEILGNNCLLLTEKIDIYEPNSKRLNYDRIWQFKNLDDFKYKLELVADFLKKDYNQENLREEYEKIMREHSSKARVLEIIEKFNA